MLVTDEASAREWAESWIAAEQPRTVATQFALSTSPERNAMRFLRVAEEMRSIAMISQFVQPQRAKGFLAAAKLLQQLANERTPRA